MSAQSRPGRRRWIWPVLLAAIAIAVWYAVHKQRPAGHPPSQAAASSSRARGSTPSTDTTPVEGPVKSADRSKPFSVSRRWGSDDQSLGRTRPDQGNPEAPMSFAITSDASALVALDQVNARLVRIDRQGRTVTTTALSERVPQDVALGPRGEIAILDRLGEQAVTIRGAAGNLLGRLPLRGQGVPEPGLVTGVFIDGQDVYVERRHGPLVLLGDLAGNAARERIELPGRPTRDGALLISAGIVDARAGRMFVSAIDRKLGEHRFTREISTEAPVHSIALLDSDRQGTIYMGVVLEAGEREARRIYCLGPQRGEPQGQIELAGNDMPEETLRDMAVMDGGGVVVTERTDQGIQYLEHDCR